MRSESALKACSDAATVTPARSPSFSSSFSVEEWVVLVQHDSLVAGPELETSVALHERFRSIDPTPSCATAHVKWKTPSRRRRLTLGLEMTATFRGEGMVKTGRRDQRVGEDL